MAVNELVMASFIDKSDPLCPRRHAGEPVVRAHCGQPFRGLRRAAAGASGGVRVAGARAARWASWALVPPSWGRCCWPATLVEAFAVPWLASAAPDVIAVPPTSGMLVIGAVFTYWGFSVGWLAFGSSEPPSARLPGRISMAIVATAVLSAIPPFFIISPPNAIPLALVVAGWGAWMMRTTTVAAADAAPVQARLSWR